jgi:hypothetical protein
VKVEIDGQPVEVEAGATVLEAAQAAGRYVPTLCFDDRMAPFGACRVCMVGAEGAAAPLAACTTPCREDMKVDTEDATARRIAAATVELVLSELPEPPAEHTELAMGRCAGRRTISATPIWPCSTSCASRAAAACAPATRCRAPSRSRPPAAAFTRASPRAWTAALSTRHVFPAARARTPVLQTRSPSTP